MSDTNALYGVVADALALRGDREAMDAFEALMGRLKDAESALESALKDMGALNRRVGFLEEREAHVRDAALEEAAKVADDWGPREVVERIRALKKTGQGA